MVGGQQALPPAAPAAFAIDLTVEIDLTAAAAAMAN